MTPAPAPLHVYEREIDAGERTSLSVLAARIPAGARVLDLGCGSGAVGRYLARRDGAAAGPIDGLTLNQEEAARAAPTYRRVEVANLDSCDLTGLFTPGSYDIIVCADVLEHTRYPGQVLAACARLLADNGRVLISIPNASYCGLVAELMAGEFLYRPEGLLDETHLRFFTRRALMRFLAEGGWVMEEVDTIKRALPDSEFRAAFDALPPAVARHLLGLPDALTYQFIVTTRPARAGEVATPSTDSTGAGPLPAQALFTAQLYLGRQGRFAEGDKLTQPGVIGQAQQTLRFDLPAGAPPSGLKFDPADRPGFMHLHALTLLAADGRPLWQWSSADPATLLQAPHAGLVLQAAALPGAPFLLLLHGQDPWLQLPVPADALAQAAGGQLHISLGWPMSADFLALAGTVEQRTLETRQLRQERDALAQELAQAQRLGLQNSHLREQAQALLAHTHTLSHERDQALKLVHDIEHSTVFRATRPIVHAKMRLDRLLGIGSARPAPAARPAPQPLTPPDLPVDVIVPVYRGLQDTRRCLQSVLAAPCHTPMRLIVINDASPEPELTAWLRDFAAQHQGRLTLLENEHNLGFVGTVNRGMAHSSDHDVLLLNSDTEVPPGWLDRLRAAAYGDQRIASVTPFSNNATICSYPRFCRDNALPEGWDTARLDALMARVNAGQSVDVPTGVGFCMYIRRAALAQLGLFDEAHFGKGYGEENDFCIRAQQAGWRNLHALDVFVRHFGGVSFGDSKSPRERAAMQTLRRLHPRYEGQVLRFVRQDPARLARTRADLARVLDGQRPVILAVVHDRAGGTERHVHELAHALRQQAQYLVLRPLPGQRVSLRLPDPQEGMELVFALPDEEDSLLALLRTLGVRHIHYHHLLGHGKFVRSLPARLGLSYDFTAHDFYAICPQISLTDRNGAYDPRRSTLPVDEDGTDLAAWRRRSAEFLNGARYVITPARDALARLLELAPGAPMRLVPHTDIDPAVALPQPAPAPLQGQRPLKVAVIGALSVIKGANVLEDVATAARKQGAPVEFHLIGYGCRTLKTQPHASLTVHGRYDEQDLPALLQWLQPDLVWFPAQWPETYSYTLSACLQGAWPVAAPDLGAFAERMAARHWSWICPWQQSPAQWLDFFTGIRARHFATGQPPEPLPPLTGIPSIATTLAIAAQPSAAWYSGEYLQGLPAPGPGTGLPPDDFITAHLPPPDSQATGTRGQALGLLARLRAHPLLAPLARAIPQHWQTRVKTWLSR